MSQPTQYADFTDPGDLPWLDREDALEQIQARQERGELTATQADACRHWAAEGWVILPGVRIEDALCDAINADVQALIDEHEGQDIQSWKIKLQNMYVRSAAVVQGMKHPAIVGWCELLLGKEMVPYQSLNMPIGSQIGPHADGVLMTTHPFGYMCASWLALEDIRDDAGPLEIWSGSHTLPYFSAAEAGIPRGGSEQERAARYDSHYYPRNAAKIEQHGLTPYRFLPKKGEVLIWHSNVLHAGSPIQNQQATRKSLITHYFAKDVHHYSDLFDRGCDLPNL